MLSLFPIQGQKLFLSLCRFAAKIYGFSYPCVMLSETDIRRNIFAQALDVHPALQVFDLGVFTSTADMSELPNRIEDTGADAIATLLLRNTHLIHVYPFSIIS